MILFSKAKDMCKTMNVPCGGIHAGQRYTVQSSVIKIVLDRCDGMFISLTHRAYNLCNVRYKSSPPRCNYNPSLSGNEDVRPDRV